MRILIIAILPFIAFSQDNYEFGPSIMVNDDSLGIHDHRTTQRSIVCWGDTVYLVWSDHRSVSHQIYFSKSTDGGNMWSPNIIISQNIDTLACVGPHIALDACNDIFVAYGAGHYNLTDWDIYFAKSTDGGITFTPPRIANDSPEVYHQKYCALAVDSAGQHVYIVWQDWRNPQYDVDIYLARSTDGGASFLPAVRVNDNLDTADQWFPVVACDNAGKHVYVAWQDGRDTLHGWDVYFSRSTDYGQTFETNYPVNDTATTGNTSQRAPSIYSKDSMIYISWCDLRDSYCVYFAKSTDNGLSFGSNVVVADDPDAGGAYPSITVDGSAKVYLVWEDGREFSTYGADIYFAYSDDTQIFNSNVLVNDHGGDVSAWDWNPSICVNEEGRIFVAWSSTRNDPSLANFDIYSAVGDYVGVQEYCWLRPAIRLEYYPNPFSHMTIIKYHMSEGADIRQNTVAAIKIYDICGRLVKQYNDGAIQPCNQITWHGDDQYGHKVPAGIYFLELVGNNAQYIGKVVKIER